MANELNKLTEEYAVRKVLPQIKEWASRLQRSEGIPDVYTTLPEYPESLSEDFNRFGQVLNLYSETPRRDILGKEGGAVYLKQLPAYLQNHLEYVESLRDKIKQDPGYQLAQERIVNASPLEPVRETMFLNPAEENLALRSVLPNTATELDYKSVPLLAHELIGHYRPWAFNLAPDVTSFKLPEGALYSGEWGNSPEVQYQTHPFTPSNEFLAHRINEYIRDLGTPARFFEKRIPLSQNTLWNRDLSVLSRLDFPRMSFGSSFTGLRGSDAEAATMGKMFGIPIDRRDISTFLKFSPEQLYGLQQSRDFFNQPMSEKELGAYKNAVTTIFNNADRLNYLGQMNRKSWDYVPTEVKDIIQLNLAEKVINPSLRNAERGLAATLPVRNLLESKMINKQSFFPKGDIDELATNNPLHAIARNLASAGSSFTLPGNVGDYVLFGADPVGAALKGIPEAVKGTARGIAKYPSSLLPGAADLIPSPEAVRAAYQQGPIEGLKQLGKDYVQGLPVAAAIPAAIAGVTSAFPTFASAVVPNVMPGVGAGLVSTAAGRALNEVVRQQTGEGIVPKLRQAIGTAPRTGIANRQQPVTTNLERPIGSRAVLDGKEVYWGGPNYGWQSRGSYTANQNRIIQGATTPTSRPAVQAEIRPLSTSGRQELQRQQGLSPMQRGIELGRQRFNPARGEFGVSEVFGGMTRQLQQLLGR